MQRLATRNTKNPDSLPAIGGDAGDALWQLPPIPRFLWDTPTAMAGLTPEDLESGINEWLRIEFPATEQRREAPGEPATAKPDNSEPVGEELASVAEVGNQISRLRNQVGFLRNSLEGAFGDLLRGSEGGKKKSFSADEVEGKVKQTLAGLKASDLMKGPATAPVMMRRGPYLNPSADA